MMRAMSLAAALALLSACATPAATTARAPAAVEPIYPALVMNDAFIGGPPPAGSAGQAWDEAQERAAATPERVAQASRDQGVNQRPDMFEAFQPVLGAEFTAARFPATAALLAGIGARIAPSTMSAKELYERPRPYVSDQSYLRCTPATDERTRAMLGPERSYPSGHSTMGFASALVLTELMPERAQALMERGFEYGRSRVICGVHWTSDVESGRVLAAGVVAQAHGLATFRAQLDAARAELRAAGLTQ